ncbi:uncharacterized protein LOC143186245 [Calliopsis andreniformis]|uniref:uncharacterized protein LOC143186245 n=1 Tax=Calliopsis andreniformis TaxID=337506 RepID=UPI003FCCD6CA
MRVKTVPRHRIVQNSENVKSVPEATTEDFEKSSNKDNKKASENMENTFDNINDCNWEAKRPADADLNKEKKKESLNFSTEALDMTIKRKVNHSRPFTRAIPYAAVTKRFSKSPDFVTSELSLNYYVLLPKENELNDNIFTLYRHNVNESYFIFSTYPFIKNSPFFAYTASFGIPCTYKCNYNLTQNQDFLLFKLALAHADNTTQRHSNHCPTNPPNCCQYSNQPLEKDTWRTTSEDKNNNTLPSRMDIGNYCSLAGPSNSEHAKLHKDESNACVDDNNDTTEVMNLCKKDCYEEDATNHSGDCDERLKDTFLYKIMTDPTFLESIQKHKQPKKFACQFCKQEFANDEELTEHMDVKKDESNQVVCCACRKTFAQKRYLRYHQRCHSERAKFTCDICTKKYTRLDNLTRHNTFHVNPDKFSCSYCEKTFARKDLLNKHLKCHDNKYRFYCESCQKYFKGPLTLDNHKKIFHSVT